MTTRKEKAEKILAVLQEENPEPVSELNFDTPWQLLVAVILSAQSTDKQVNKVTANLFAKYPSPQDMAELTPEELAEDIKSLGLFRNKAKHLVGAARAILDQHGGEVPRTLAKLQSLPGVGRKTANVVLANAFGVPALAVDTHVFRVANRLGLAKAKTPEETEKQLSRAIPRSLWADAHHWLILHGRYICVARKPRCFRCPVTQWCSWYQKEQKSSLKRGAKL
ncbi:endonuclease III [Dethiobacter alkaliphilus]|uniref:endonuclease III n=1 Tax=Dethiobacter alkaliphilus TaxID=427926 RepID=UPI002227193B|nr:endonuclease III [Dethiobacter alkaliphilus]MCW3490709.1 endonuclease III [Dethiobacter alkaliphilus]